MSSTLEDAYLIVTLNEQVKKLTTQLEAANKTIAELKGENAPNANSDNGRPKDC
jgi:archaellum component FlaC